MSEPAERRSPSAESAAVESSDEPRVMRRSSPTLPPAALSVSLSDPKRILTGDQLAERDRALRNLPGERL